MHARQNSFDLDDLFVHTDRFCWLRLNRTGKLVGSVPRVLRGLQQRRNVLDLLRDSKDRYLRLALWSLTVCQSSEGASMLTWAGSVVSPDSPTLGDTTSSLHS